MWNKVKTVLSIIGAVLTVLLLTVLLFVLRGGKAHGRGGTDDSERDSRIQEGIDSCEKRAGRIEEGIGRCEERLQRAEDILREAIKRSREGEPEAEEDCNSNKC